MGTESEFGTMKKFQRWVRVMTAQQHEYTLCHWSVHLKMVKVMNFILHTFYCTEKETIWYHHTPIRTSDTWKYQMPNAKW